MLNCQIILAFVAGYQPINVYSVFGLGSFVQLNIDLEIESVLQLQFLQFSLSFCVNRFELDFYTCKGVFVLFIEYNGAYIYIILL